MFSDLHFLKNKKYVSDNIFRNEGPGFWVKKTIQLQLSSGTGFFDLESPIFLGPLFWH